jgi:hypothetical protein
MILCVMCVLKRYPMALQPVGGDRPKYSQQQDWLCWAHVIQDQFPNSSLPTKRMSNSYVSLLSTLRLDADKRDFCPPQSRSE